MHDVRSIGILALVAGLCATVPEPAAADPPDRSNGVRGVEASLRQQLRTSTHSRHHVLLEFDTPLSLEQHYTLARRGCALHCYRGNSTYLMTLPRGVDLGDRDVVPSFRFARALTPEEKLDGAIFEADVPDWARVPELGIRALVQFFPDVDRCEARRLVGSIGEPHGPNNWAVVATRDQLAGLALEDSIRWIQPGPRPSTPTVATGRALAKTDVVQLGSSGTPPEYEVGGKGVRLGICDQGLDIRHCAFFPPTEVCDVADPNRAPSSRTYGPEDLALRHGTLVASIAAASGTAWDPDDPADPGRNGPWSIRGHAPEAMIGAFSQIRSDVAEHWRAIEDLDTVVTNHSYYLSDSRYETETEGIDTLIRGGAEYVDDSTAPPTTRPIAGRTQVWSAGNLGISSDSAERGYYSLGAVTKNAIVVGSVDSLKDDISEFSSWGPTRDGRIKPDLAAPGCRDSTPEFDVGIVGAWDQYGGYIFDCGTSMAAPAVTGIVALMMQAAGDTGLLPSTYKAMLVNTAREMSGTAWYPNPDTEQQEPFGEGPDPATGYGLVDAERAVATAKEKRYREGEIGYTGDVQEYCVQVRPGLDALRVTLAWDDPAYCAESATYDEEPKLVNDLDLRLVHVDSKKVIRPWVLDPTKLPPTDPPGFPHASVPADLAVRRENHVDNVERIDVGGADLLSGPWKIEVTGHSLPTVDPQPFSVASSLPIVPCKIDFKPPRLKPPWDALVRICERFPRLCDRPWLPNPVRPPRWPVEPEQFLPVDAICREAIDCPACDGAPWERCPGLDLRLKGVPKKARVVVVDDRYGVVLEDERRSTTRTIRLERRPGERYYVVFVDAEGRPFERPFKLKVATPGGRH